jgi:hypothetical protein
MRSASAVLFGGAAAAVMAVGIASRAPLIAAGAALLGILWILLEGSRSAAATRAGVRSTLLAGLAALLVAVPLAPLPSVSVACGALGGWHLGRVADRIWGMRGPARGALLVRQILAVGIVLGCAVGVVAAAGAATLELSFWIAVGLGSALLLLSGLWVVLTRQAAETEPSEPNDRAE